MIHPAAAKTSHGLHDSLEGSQGSAVAHMVWFIAVSSQSGTKEGKGTWPSLEETEHMPPGVPWSGSQQACA